MNLRIKLYNQKKETINYVYVYIQQYYVCADLVYNDTWYMAQIFDIGKYT